MGPLRYSHVDRILSAPRELRETRLFVDIGDRVRHDGAIRARRRGSYMPTYMPEPEANWAENNNDC